MKKKLAKPLSLLLTVAMVVGVAQTGFPHVYAAEGEVGGEGASVRPAADWKGPAGSPGELAASEEQEFVFPFVTTGSAVLAELEFDIYLGKDGDNAEENRDYKTAVQFDLEADDATLTLNSSDINSALQNNLLKDQEIAFYEAAGAEFHYEGGKAVSVKEDSIDKVKENLSYISEDDNKTGEWEFSLNTALLAEKGYSDIEFLVTAHTDDPEVSWGNNNYNAPEKGDTQAYLYTIKAEDPDEGETEAKVGTADELKEALADEDIETIQLTKDITIDSGENLVVTNPVTIDGNNHKLSFSGLDSKSNDTNDALVIAAEDSTVKNLTVDAGLTAAETWKGSYAIQAYNTSGVVLQEVKATGANGGVYVNSSTVTLEGTIDVSGNGFGGIEVSNGANPVGDLMLTAQKRTRFINTSEAYGRPTVWLDGITKENADEYVDGLSRFIRVNGDNQTLYYLDEAHRYDPEAVATVGTIGGLQDALKKDSIDFIRLTEDITGVSSSIEVKREVVIDGDGHMLGFENLEGASSTVDDGLILYQPATVKDLTVDAGLKDLSNNPEAWKGTYAIHAYNTKGVILEDVTATGANGGILVNSSEVSLQGTIDVSGNGFGGIEVSKGAQPVGDLLLNVRDADFINESEKNGLPTIWVDGTSDLEQAEKLIEVSTDTFTAVSFTEDDKTQVHYYLDDRNAKTPTTVKNAEELTDALSSSAKVIQLSQDITIPEKQYINITRPVILDGNGYQLVFSGLQNLENANHDDDAVIVRAEAEGAKIQDLTVNAGLSNPKTWVGTYAIHLYDAEEITLYNVKATGANGGILVNSSDVTLKGNIDVSGNGFGGIEVSKANESADDPYLNAEENVSFANTSEAYGEPTIWVDGTADKDEAENWLTVDEDTFTAVPFAKNSKTQVHYYLDAAHSVEPVPDSPQITVTGVPEGTVSTENKIAETDAGKITEFSADARTPIQVSLTKGSEDYNNVRVIVTLVKEDAEVTEGIQLIAQDTNHAWWNIVKSGWGPGEGFELKDAETDVYLVAYEPGEYTANIQLIDVSDKNNVVVLAEKSASITAVAPEILHTVTLTNGGTGSSGGGSYAATATVPINAGTRSGYSFNGWTASPAVTFANAASAVTTFIMPAGDVTVTANWKSNSSSRDDDDNSSSGGSSSKPSTGNQDTSGTVTTNPAPGGGTVTTVTTQPSSTVVTGGAAQITAAVPDSAAAAIASATPQSPAQVSISVPTAAVAQQLQNAEVTKASLTITVPPAVANNTNANAQVVVNADAGLLNAARVAGKDLEITIQNAQTGRTAYAWSFSGSALAQATEIRSLNLALSVQPTSSVPAAQSAAPSSAGIVLRFANNGQLPAPATVTVDVSSQGYQPGQVLYFYYLNPNTGRLEAMNNAQPITVNAQGYAAVTVTHNSDFVLLPKKPGSLTLDTVSYTLPKGKAYEIGAKLAGEGATLKVTPSRSGIVKIENTKSGNYKVTGLTNGITYVSFDVYSGGKLVSHSSVKITVQSSGKAQGVAGRRVMNF